MTDETKDQKIARLEAELAKVTAERDEADRLAGAARRELEDKNDTLQRYAQWRDQKKEKHGFNRNVSMDRVWEFVEGKALMANGAVDLLKQFRSLVNEGSVPRYTVVPGAALNTVVTDVDRFLSK